MTNSESHGVDPDKLPLQVDATPLHALVDKLGAALHDYVDTCVGVRAEFDVDTADDDPRVEAAEDVIDHLNQEFDETFESMLSMVCSHTGYPIDDDEEDEDPDVDEDAVILELNFERTEGTSPQVTTAIVETMNELDTVAQRLAERFESRGVNISHWSCVHERYPSDDDEDE